MKRVPFSTLVLGSAVVSIAMVYSTDLPARDKSSQGASVSAGGVNVSAGGVSVSVGRGGASVSAGRGNASVSADRGGASVSGGGASVSAGRGGAGVSGGGERVSADRGGASVSAGRGGASVSGGGERVSADRGGASVSADRGDADVGSKGGMKAPAVPATATGRPVGDRSYDSIGDWFEDLRSSLFGGEHTAGDVVNKEEVGTTTTHSSTTHTTEISDSGRTQVSRVIQRQSSTEIATEGGSASAEASNVSEIEQKN